MTQTSTVNDSWELEIALEDLGSTAAEVAASLRNLGIKGEQGSCGHCPIAQWALGLGFFSSYVDQETTTIWDESDNRIDGCNPDPVQEFIVAFDEGDFPSLILEEDDD
jgi:hypothetical protein